MAMMSKLHKAEDLTDTILLERLNEHDGRLLDDERVAFRNMLKRGDDLTVPQQEWARKVYDRLHLAKEYGNKRKPKKAKPKELKKEWWESKEYHPTRPPGMK